MTKYIQYIVPDIPQMAGNGTNYHNNKKVTHDTCSTYWATTYFVISVLRMTPRNVRSL